MRKGQLFFKVILLAFVVILINGCSQINKTNPAEGTGTAVQEEKMDSVAKKEIEGELTVAGQAGVLEEGMRDILFKLDYRTTLSIGNRYPFDSRLPSASLYI